MFEKIIAIDWSGAGLDDKTNSGLAVAFWPDAGGKVDIQEPIPKSAHNQKYWRRSHLLDWLRKQISPDQPRTLVLMDFPFSFPYGTAAAWGAGTTWQNLVRFVAGRFEEGSKTGARRLATGFASLFHPRSPHLAKLQHSGPYIAPGITQQSSPGPHPSES